MKEILGFICMCVSFIILLCVELACICTSCVCLLITEARRGCCILWNWSYRQLSAAMWMLGMSSGRGASALNCGAISPAPHILYF